MRNPALFLAAISLLSRASAQTVGGQWGEQFRYAGATVQEHAGSAVGAADLDGDGILDLLIGSGGADPGGLQNAGSVFAWSGSNGALLWQVDGARLGAQFGSSLATVGDLDADGRADFAAGAPYDLGGTVYLLSGASGALLQRLDGPPGSQQLGLAVAAAGDTDADGVPDILAASPLARPSFQPAAGTALVFSGADGSLLLRFDGTTYLEHLGSAIAGAGDVDQDGHADLLVGDENYDAGGLLHGAVFVYSGRDGSTLRRYDASNGAPGVGAAVALAGDVDGDGVPDALLGVPASSPAGRASAGSAAVFSGASGALLLQMYGPQPYDSLGYSVAVAGDVDGDGLSDWLVGSELAQPRRLEEAGTAIVFSGADLRVLYRLDGQEEEARLGSLVAGLGDFDGDGRAEFAIGSPGASSGGISGSGLLQVLGFDPLLALDAGTLSLGSGIPVHVALDFPGSEAGLPYALLISATGTGPSWLSGVQVPLSSDLVYLRMLTGWSPPALHGAFGRLSSSGDATALVSATQALQNRIGRSFYLAALSYEPQTYAPRLVSVARALRVQP